ncbi:MAG: tetratricopeptide repeat protein, partial [Gammaproteobacteria bacterium]|nr:tetratricopeptide repeat protein [Gammaproteobacteria bacterium]
SWQNSHHDLAMQEATDATVLGDFNNTQYRYHDVTSSFYKKDNKFYVKTDNAQGELQEFEIKYTFGVTPLQQYLIEFPGGRLQALNIVWDTRPKDQGGQRWIHLYPNENVDHKDPLHWTGIYQNWNIMCAECHSTNLRKNYDLASDSYQTKWSEIDVSCEACHGPASNHVTWANSAAQDKSWRKETNKGLVVNLTDTADSEWQLRAGDTTAKRSIEHDASVQLNICARCHSRRGVLTDVYRHGKPLLDSHSPALLTDELYYADGQIKDEVYVYGSFLQSKMYKEGVICGDCHDPHSLKLKAQGNNVCTRCHNGETFDTQKHHHHAQSGKAAQCVSCHMPARTYMVVDPRRDHSFRVPRPDLSEKIQTPNACNGCHDKQTASWASQQVKSWFGDKTRKSRHYGEIIDAGRRGLAQADIDLAELASNKDNPDIVRATAISLLDRYAYPRLPDLLRQTLNDQSALVRTAALSALPMIDPNQQLELGFPLLSDPIRLVRTTAASVLINVPANNISAEKITIMQSSVNEYLENQYYNADRPEGLTNLGTFYMNSQQFGEAEKYFKLAIEKGPALAQAYVNLADLYRLQQQDQKGEAILHQGLKASLNKPPIHHALGLLLVRQQKLEEALQHLKAAADQAPNQARYQYVYGVALQSSNGTPAAVKYLQKAYKQHPADINILYALASFNFEMGDTSAAQKYTSELLILAPQHQGAQQLMQQLDDPQAQK